MSCYNNQSIRCSVIDHVTYGITNGVCSLLYPNSRGAIQCICCIHTCTTRNHIDQVYALGRACDNTDHARTLRKDAAGAILYSAEKATWMAGEAIQTLGGVGYTNEYATGRLWRDAKLYEIGAGTSEIRRMLIGRELFAETA